MYAVAGLLVLAAALLMALTAARWPSRAARFERPGAGQVPGAAEVAADLPRDDDPAALWRLLDAGVDPRRSRTGARGGRPRDERTDEPTARTHPGGPMCTNNLPGSQ